MILVLPYPISANRYWGERVVPAGKGRPAFVNRYVTPDARAYRETVAKMALAAGVREPIHGRVRVRIELYPHRPLDWQTRQRKLGEAWDDSVQCIDLDNARKVLLDALNGIAFDDDSRIWSDGGDRMEPDAQGARVVVSIEPIVSCSPQFALPMVLPVVPREARNDPECDPFGPLEPRKQREHMR